MKPLSLQKAETFANTVADQLAPLCLQRPFIVGSIRRKRAICNDVDLVIIPKDKREIRARCMQKGGKLLEDGNLNLIIELATGIQLDIFYAREAEKDLFGQILPCTFGTLVLCRTGSKDFNIWLCREAEKKGLHWNPYQGLMKPDYLNPGKASQFIAGETEESIFKALDIDFIKPEDRER